MGSTDLHWCPDLGQTYTLPGKQVKINSPDLENPWLALFGSLEFPTGEGIYTLHERKCALDLCQHLQLVIDSEPTAFWFIVLDNASAHTTPLFHDFARRYQERLELVYLPTYSPHLNLIERLCRLLRLQVTRNRFYPSLTVLAQATVAWLEQLPLAQFCSLLGIDDAALAFLDKPFL